ncbi:MAG: molybdopterin dehydrogenase [Spirochaetales bacterium]|nr:molybdopterin dehydrogenase [Spirochaetales bacterium]
MIGEFIRTTSPRESLGALHNGGEGAQFIAGGTEILRLGSLVEAKKVVSLKGLNLSGISEEKGIVTIGATTTFQEALENEVVPPYLKEALLYCGSYTRRNMATIGGNIALRRDDSYLSPTLIAAKARLILGDIASDGKYGEENIPIREYHSFDGHFEGSLILRVVLNKPKRFVASLRYARTVQSPAALTISLGADISSGAPHDVRIAAAIKGTGVVRLIEVENGIMEGHYATVEDAAAHAGQDLVLVDDITGSGAYKKYILTASVAELYKQCLDAISKGGAQ